MLNNRSVMSLARAAVLGVGLLATACSMPQIGAGPTPTPSEAAAPAPTTPAPTAPASVPPAEQPATPPAEPTAAPTPAPAARYACTNFSGGSTTSGASVVAVRVGRHDSYDRFVIEFSGAVPGYSVSRQGDTRFTLSPSGQPATLEGAGGLLLKLQPVPGWESFQGPSRLLPRYPALREVRLLENFEAVQQWGLGVEGDGCLAVFTLGAPSRLVVDIAH